MKWRPPGWENPINVKNDNLSTVDRSFYVVYEVAADCMLASVISEIQSILFDATITNNDKVKKLLEKFKEMSEQ